MISPKAALASARDKRPFLDHLIRAFGRYQADAGDRQAAAVTFFGFLSFFPILALATSVLSYALGDQDLVLGEGEAAEFDTQVPHWFGSTGAAPAEVLSIFGRPGERMLVRASGEDLYEERLGDSDPH